MNKDEDEHFFNLIQKLDEYNSKDVQKVSFSKEKEDRKDVLTQHYEDSNYTFLKDGTRFYKVIDEEVATPDVLKKFYDLAQKHSEETGEPLEPVEWEEFGPENKGFDPTDPFWIEF